MINVCPSCGIYSVDKEIDPTGPFAICPHCGHRQRFVQLPLFVITGASGAGKTTLCLELVSRLAAECVVLESDVLWGPEFDKPEDNYRRFRDVWLRLAKNVSQTGRPVVLCGTAVPDQLEVSPERRYFTAVHYLALVCDDAVLARRLQDRPGWRQSAAPELVEKMRAFNGWLRDNRDRTTPPMTVLDTTDLTVAETVERAAEWVGSRVLAGC